MNALPKLRDSRCQIELSMRTVIAVSLVAIAGCGGAGETPAQSPSGEEALLLVNDDWRIVEMATAHGAFTIEVEMAEGVDTDEIARSLIQPLQDRYAEVLVYFHARDAQTDLPQLRVQWTAAGGYVETRYR